MSYKTRLVDRYVGWQFEGLLPCPYTKDRKNAELTAHFRYVVLVDGVEIPQKTKIHLPEMIALTEEEIRDTTAGSRGSIMGVSRTLRENALSCFAVNQISKPTAEIIPLPRHQMAAGIPAETRKHQMEA